MNRCLLWYQRDNNHCAYGFFFLSVFTLCVKLTMYTKFGNEFFFLVFASSFSQTSTLFFFLRHFFHTFFLVFLRKIRQSLDYIFFVKVSMSWFWFAFRVYDSLLFHSICLIIPCDRMKKSHFLTFIAIFYIFFYLRFESFMPRDKFDSFETKG